MSNELLAYNNYLSYAKYMDEKYLAPDHVVKLAAHLEAVEAGLIELLIVVFPPRHSKSFNVAEFFPAWYLGRNPSKYIIYSTYGEELSHSFGRKVRNQLTDPMFSKVFPKCKVSLDSQSKKEISTTDNGVYTAVGRGGSVTGKGANLLILDDMLKDNKEAESRKQRQDLIDWYKSVASTRLQKGASEIMMGTRWNTGDLIGWAIKNMAHKKKTVILHMPAINDKDEALWPEMFDLEQLLKIKDTLGTYFWNALYQGNPTAREGNLFKREWFRYYYTMPRKFDCVIQSWDASFKDKKTSSYVVGQLWGKLGANVYLIDQIRAKMGFQKTLKSIMIMTDKYKESRTKLVEDKANGSAIIETLKNKIAGILPVNPEGSKYARAEAVSWAIESGNVYIPHPDHQSWVGDYLDEHLAFPNGEYDDQVDCTTQALKYFFGDLDPVTRLKNLLKM